MKLMARAKTILGVFTFGLFFFGQVSQACSHCETFSHENRAQAASSKEHCHEDGHKASASDGKASSHLSHNSVRPETKDNNSSSGCPFCKAGLCLQAYASFPSVLTLQTHQVDQKLQKAKALSTGRFYENFVSAPLLLPVAYSPPQRWTPNWQASFSIFII